MSEPIFFATPDEFRAWLEANHDRHDEVIVGFDRERLEKLAEGQ